MLRKFSAFGRLPSFRRARGEKPIVSRGAEYTISVLFFFVVLGLRFLIDPILPPGFPYLTFFPAVVISGFVFGVRQGIVVAVLSGLASWYFFIAPFHAFGMSASTLVAMALYVFVVVTDLFLIHMMMKAYAAELDARHTVQAMSEHQLVMAQELDHRLKNVFATMNAVISLSRRHASTPEELAVKLRERLNAMGRSNMLLRGLDPNEDTTLDAVLSQAIEPFGIVGTPRLIMEGGRVKIGGQAVIMLSLILHELGTNAAKYGALSAPGGKILLKWETGPSGERNDKEALTIRWIETGGPQPVAPAEGEGGFGSTLINRVIAAVNGTSEIQYLPSGVVASLVLPMDMVLPGSHVAAG